MTTQMARFRKFEFIGVPSCPGASFGATSAPGTCHAAPPLGEVRCGFNIGVYRIFAKHRSRLEIAGTGMRMRPVGLNKPIDFRCFRAPRARHRSFRRRAPSCIAGPQSRAEIRRSRPCPRPEIDGRHGKQLAFSPERGRQEKRRRGPGRPVPRRLSSREARLADRAHLQAALACRRPISMAKRPSHSALARTREDHDRQRQPARARARPGRHPPPP